MIKRISLLVAAALMAVMMMSATAAPAFAAKCPNGDQAENLGGGFKQCEEEGKNPKFSETLTQKGSFSSSHPRDEDCNRPGQTEKCPPGQFN